MAAYQTEFDAAENFIGLSIFQPKSAIGPYNIGW
jgi:hypothetical protein